MAPAVDTVLSEDMRETIQSQRVERIPPSARNHNLPGFVTRFVARKRELAEVEKLLARSRLITLTGVGGIGKTRLAVEAGRRVLRRFRDGVWLVDLSGLSDPSLVPAAVASVLGVREGPGRPLTTSLVEACRPRQALLILDNCEHLVAACARVVDELLKHCDAVRILATSRERLGLAGEVTWQVPSLSLPNLNRLDTPEQALGSGAAELFVERVAEARPGFKLTDRDSLSVAQICHRLDGIPLALELAAARARTLSLGQIAARLEHPLRLLASGTHSVLPRHRTLRAAIDWSYQLLDEPERILLRRLALFVGSWTLDGAERIVTGDGIGAAEVLDLLTSLIEKSLIIAEDHGSEFRYRLLETVRDYAHERLIESGELEALRQRYSVCLSALADRCDDGACLPLTPREQEIATLVSQGLTNREIGAQLIISEGTVRIHLEHTFRKLDIRSRSQLAVLAARQIAPV